MLFSSMVFLWVFLPVVLLGNFLVNLIHFQNHSSGISFFTFRAMSYVIDVYRNDAKLQTNIECGQWKNRIHRRLVQKLRKALPCQGYLSDSF